MPAPSDLPYDELLAALSIDHPHLAAELQHAQDGRRQRLGEYTGGARLAGIEAVVASLTYLLDALTDQQPLRMLVDRVRKDFVVAAEAILAGNLAYALDCMRDVLEIELLFRDFTDTPSNASLWLNDSNSKRWQRFQPSVIRRRLASHGKPVGEGRDYAAHSGALHPSPPFNLFGDRGFYPLDSQWVDGGFWELFQHARRLMFALHGYLAAIGLLAERDLVDVDKMPALIRAWERTQEMQVLMLGPVRPPSE